MPNSDREFLRHALATLAYRAAKPLRDAPAGFSAYRCTIDTRTPGEIVAHLGDLMEWGKWMARGTHRWSNTTAGDWRADVDRFFSELAEYDQVLAGADPLADSCEKLFQGSIADALTHVGQLTMLRRMHGAPIRGENYAKADIRSGQLGLSQPAARVEFD
jgi:hypothetical protein